MNPTTDPPPQPHRSSFTCDRHPDENFSGFCPSCLCERLTTLDQSSASSSRRPSTSTATTSAAAAIRALFKVPNSTTTATAAAETTTNSKAKAKPSFFPELRRTQSFSASKNEGFSGVFEPQRKSCDVRARNGNSTLWSLFSIENENKSSQNHHPINADVRIVACSASNSVAGPVIESKEEDEHDDDEIRVLEEPNVINLDEEASGEIIEEDLKTMKDHIDIDSQPKKPSASFWSAASVFSKKWQKWRRKQKVKKTNTGGESSALPVEKPISRQYRETQSEIADYGFGRRSCDMDPRFSLDAGRISFDDPRYSFEEPRASWDGYMIGRAFPRLPPMLSVVEDSPAPAPAPAVHVSRSDAYIPVEEVETLNSINKEEIIPGGSIQTKEYYADSSSRRRKSFDRSNSIRRTAAAIVAGIDETKANSNSNSNSKVSPATIDSFNGAKNNFNQLRDDSSEAFGLKENGERKEMKKSRKWNWNIWAFIQKRGNGNGNGSGVINRNEDDERYSRGNRIGIDRSYSQSWQETRGENVGYNPRMNRSNSSVSWRNSIDNGGSFSSGRKSNVETSDNGLARFYLGPLSSSRRSGGWNSKPNGSNSISRNVVRMY